MNRASWYHEQSEFEFERQGEYLEEAGRLCWRNHAEAMLETHACLKRGAVVWCRRVAEGEERERDVHDGERSKMNKVRNFSATFCCPAAQVSCVVRPSFVEWSDLLFLALSSKMPKKEAIKTTRKRTAQSS